MWDRGEIGHVGVGVCGVENFKCQMLKRAGVVERSHFEVGDVKFRMG